MKVKIYLPENEILEVFTFTADQMNEQKALHLAHTIAMHIELVGTTTVKIIFWNMEIKHYHNFPFILHDDRAKMNLV